MPEHVYEKHESCEKMHCSICDGGLSVCTVCHCIEGSLPTECPGYPCYTEKGDAIYAGKIDFKGGAWVEIAPCPYCHVHAPGWLAEDLQRGKRFTRSGALSYHCYAAKCID